MSSVVLFVYKRSQQFAYEGVIRMDKKMLIENVVYLINKYLPERSDLVDLIMQDTRSVKYIMYQIEIGNERAYDEKDSELVQDIAFYYL
ncbi:MAG: hypothetical protein HDR20_11455 [Lachnospiraceae bacterium]|nr:hypothetical protein [Lachnospiraceae bacterium]